jgi:hypothetical protein
MKQVAVDWRYYQSVTSKSGANIFTDIAAGLLAAGATCTGWATSVLIVLLTQLLQVFLANA